MSVTLAARILPPSPRSGSSSLGGGTPAILVRCALCLLLGGAHILRVARARQEEDPHGAASGGLAAGGRALRTGGRHRTKEGLGQAKLGQAELDLGRVQLGRVQCGRDQQAEISLVEVSSVEFSLAEIGDQPCR
eukprot:4339963-Pyramimonas_sp.AAC.1